MRGRAIAKVMVKTQDFWLSVGEEVRRVVAFAFFEMRRLRQGGWRGSKTISASVRGLSASRRNIDISVEYMYGVHTARISMLMDGQEEHRCLTMSVEMSNMYRTMHV